MSTCGPKVFVITTDSTGNTTPGTATATLNRFTASTQPVQSFNTAQLGVSVYALNICCFTKEPSVYSSLCLLSQTTGLWECLGPDPLADVVPLSLWAEATSNSWQLCGGCGNQNKGNTWWRLYWDWEHGVKNTPGLVNFINSLAFQCLLSVLVGVILN